MQTTTEKPATGFDSFDLCDPVRRGVETAGFVEPRPVQLETIPAALEGRDVLGLAQTGTGKTAAFALPILHRLSGGRRAAGPRALIVAPTRELARQIADECELLGRHTRLSVAVIFGGVTMGKQIAALRARPDVLVACPGRLLDLYRQGELTLDHVETLVLDEADHMFDMGFLPDVRRILEALPERRQNLLFSATMPPEIRGLAKRVLHRPHTVDLTRSRPAPTIDHAIYPIVEGDKRRLLDLILGEDGFVSAIVFTRTKHRAKRLARQLDAAGHRAVALQGNMSQNARVRAMEGFRRHEFDILVATDIAARGIDVQQVSHVINFDMPNTPDAYTHRIGRTGRAERSGRAYTFVTDDDRPMVEEVEQRIGRPLERRAIEGVPAIPFEAGRRRPAGGLPRRAADGPARPTGGRRRRRRRRGSSSPGS